MIPQSSERDVALNYLEPAKFAELDSALGELRDGILTYVSAEYVPQLAAAWSRLAVVAEAIRTAAPGVA